MSSPSESRQAHSFLRMVRHPFFLGFAATAVLGQIVLLVFLVTPPVFLKYPLAAARLLRGELGWERLLDYSPLYLGLHAALTPLGALQPWALTLLQMFLADAAVLFLLALVAPRVRPSVLGLAGLIAALYPGFILYAAVGEPEILLAFLLASGLYAGLGRMRSGTAGAMFGLAVLTRPSVLPFALLAGALVSGRRCRYYAALGPAVLILLVISWTAVGTPTLAFMSPGTVFHEGNNPHAAGIGALYPPPLKLWEDAWSAREADYAHELYRRVATEETGKELFPGAHARFWLGKAWGYIATHPAAWAALTLRKIWLEFSSFEIHDLAGLAQAAGHLEVLPFPPFGLFAGLALLGAISFRREIPKIIWAGSAWFALVPVLFYVSARQRMPLWLFLLFLSGLGMEAVFRKPWRLILLAVLAGLSFWIPVQARQYREMTARIRTADQWKNEVKKDLVSGARGKAAQDMSRCIGAAPWLELYHSAPFLPYPGGSPQAGALADSEAPRTPFERGVLCFSLGRDEEVAKLLEPGAGKPFYRHYYAVEPPAYYMSASLYRLGRTEEARSALARGLAAFPMNGPLLALKEAIEGTPFGAKGHDLLSRHHYLGRAFFHLKMYRLALPHFEALSVLAPELLYPHDYLGVCHGMMGRYVEMARELDLLERTRPASSLTPQWREVLARMEAEGREDPFLIRLREAMQKMFPQAISSP